MVVLDPVLRSSSGADLLDSEGIRVLRERLLQRVDWITPNLDELAELTGMLVTPRAREFPRQQRSCNGWRGKPATTG